MLKIEIKMREAWAERTLYKTKMNLLNFKTFFRGTHHQVRKIINITYLLAKDRLKERAISIHLFKIQDQKGCSIIKILKAIKTKNPRFHGSLSQIHKLHLTMVKVQRV